MELTPQQRKKAEKLISVLEKGDVAVMEYLLELEDKMSKMDDELKRGLDANSRVDMIKIKGDRGDNYVLTDEDKQYIAEISTSLIDREEIKGDKGENYILTDKDKKDIAKSVVVPKVEKIIIEKQIPFIDTENIVSEASKMAIEEIKPNIPTIDAIESDLPKLGDKIRDGLELLQGDDRLDASAIKNLPVSKNNQTNVVAGVRIFDALLNVNTNGKVDGSVPEWDSSTGMWVMGTGGDGVDVGAGKLVGKGSAGIKTSYEGSNDDFENFGSNNTLGAAQGFQIQADASITSISFWGSRGNVAPSTGTFTVEIRSGSLSGTIVKTETFNRSDVSAYSGGTASWQELTFSTPVSLTANTQYYLKLIALDTSVNDSLRWAVDNTSPSYIYGSYALDNVADIGKDRSFRINGSATSNEEISLDSTLAMTGATLGATGIFNSNVKLNTAGNGIYIKEGSNATMGTATANGTTEVTVNTTKVTANSRIFLTCQVPGGTPSGIYYVSSRSVGTSFGFKSAVGDTSTVAWIIIEPA